MIHTERIHRLNSRPILPGKFVLYRMQASQRMTGNLALNEAARQANTLGLPLRIFFHIESSFPDSNYRHFRFMFQGLTECMRTASLRGIRFETGTDPFEYDIRCYFNDAAIIFCDKGYLHIQREWSRWLSETAPCRVIEVEDNLTVPVELVSSRAEWSARTIRPRIMEKLGDFITDAYDPFPVLAVRDPADGGLENKNQRILDRVLEKVRSRDGLTECPMRGGESEAHRQLDRFIEELLPHYSVCKNEPSRHATSRLSPYLHFGQISPLQILSRMLPGDHNNADIAAFVEELAVRRELAHNYVYHTPGYDTYEALPAWCRKTLAEHLSDTRPYIYRLDQLDEAKTHDPYWNAAMNEMKHTGFMENTMRMYWGKKILEWTTTPEEAYRIALCLNNRYLLDGRDANSYAGVGWCFGLHDRPWSPRPVFGTIRYMNQSGLLRKHDMRKYLSENELTR